LWKNIKEKVEAIEDNVLNEVYVKTGYEATVKVKQTIEKQIQSQRRSL